ncbi:CDK-activating kinase assembly factor MAT1-domain-containing protein [Blastocladiella britannica]|nr:CDK-activating kinase assembly factor MAT1-domain-containing protein [Blastocladiella britannica]
MEAPELDEERSARRCDACKKERNQNSDDNERVFATPCLHRICSECRRDMTNRHNMHCPVPNCGRYLRASDFQEPIFFDLGVDREVRVRKRIMGIYNKTLDDFGGSRHAYNDYLEEIEDIVYNLSNDVDVEETNKRVEAYHTEHKEAIRKNKERASANDVLKRIQEREQKNALQRQQDARQLFEQEALMEVQRDQDLVSALAGSSDDAKDILRQHERRVKEEDAELSAIGAAGSNSIVSPSRRRANASSSAAATSASAAATQQQRSRGPRTFDAYDAANHGGDDSVFLAAGAIDALATLDVHDPMRHVAQVDTAFPYHDAHIPDELRRGMPAHAASGFSMNVPYTRAIQMAFRGLLVSPPAYPPSPFDPPPQ